MGAQRGKDLLLKVDEAGSGTFETVAGLRTRTLSFNSELVDVTHAESAGEWRELLGGAGVKSARVSGSGVFKDAASDETVRSAFFSGALLTWQMAIPDFGIVTGPFHISSFELTGRHDGEVTFELSLDSAGELSFTAV